MKLRLILLMCLAVGVARSFAADAQPPSKAVSPPANPPAAPATTTAVAPKPSGAVPKIVGATPRNESSVTPSGSFDAFRVVTDRNIFNPNRTGRRERTTEEAPPRSDTITLVGTMDSDKGLRAFFDGTDAAYRKALLSGGMVETFKVVKISANTVDLERDGKSFPVRVGQQLRRPPGGEWSLIGEDLARLESQSRPNAAAATAIPADASDMEKKMRERRLQQQNLKN